MSIRHSSDDDKELGRCTSLKLRENKHRLRYKPGSGQTEGKGSMGLKKTDTKLSLGHANIKR